MTTTSCSDAEAELREQEAKYRTLFASLDAGFCIIDLKFDALGDPTDYRFLEVNPAFERQTGLADAEGKWVRSLVPEHEQHWFDIYGEVARGGEPVRFERPARALQNRWYDVYAFRIGEPYKHQVAVLFNDITQRKRSEAALAQAHRELQAMSAELQRSNEDLEQFARLAGHDLRAPLSNMIQFSQLLAKRHGDKLEGEGQAVLDVIVESGKRMETLIDDLLRYATFTQTAMAPAAPIWVGLACLQAKENLRVTVEETGAEIECQVPNGVLVAVELSLLTVVLQNLMGNAMQYRRAEAIPRIRVAAVPEDEFWKISVQDNGAGFEMRFAAQIFEPFRRLYGQERPGSGIGLATCKRVIEKAGGRIWVHSRVGEGSTFHFLLPRG